MECSFRLSERGGSWKEGNSKYELIHAAGSSAADEK